MQDREVQDKFQRLVQQLVSGTQKGKIAWTDTVDAYAFRAYMQGGMVRVQKRLYLDEEGQEAIDYSLTLLDRDGRELEEYCPEPLESHRAMVDLWNLARRSSRGAVDVLNKLLKETALEER